MEFKCLKCKRVMTGKDIVITDYHYPISYDPDIKSSMYSVSGDIYCKDCVQDYINEGIIRYCKNCDIWTTDREGKIYDEKGNHVQSVCSLCYDIIFSLNTCRLCHRTFTKGTKFAHGVCPCCSPTAYLVNGKKHLVQKSHEHKDNLLTFFTLKHKYKDQPKHLLFLGAEIELDFVSKVTAEKAEQDCKQIQQCFPNDFVYFEEDSSICGYEVITQPATIQKHIASYYNYVKMFDSIRINNSNPITNVNSGFHVHFNIDFFPAEIRLLCIERLIRIVQKEYYNLLELTGRTVDDANEYCGYMNEPDIKEVLKLYERDEELDIYWNQLPHTTAVSFMSKDSPEIRIFNGAMKPIDIIRNLIVAHNIIMLARNIDIPIENITIGNILDTKYFKKILDKYIDNIV